MDKPEDVFEIHRPRLTTYITDCIYGQTHLDVDVDLMFRRSTLDRAYILRARVKNLLETSVLISEHSIEQALYYKTNAIELTLYEMSRQISENLISRPTIERYEPTPKPVEVVRYRRLMASLES